MPIMNMTCSNAVECGFATVGTPDMWLLPFLLRATPRLDLTGWSLRSEVNHDSDRALERHTRPDPERYESRNALAQDHLLGHSALVEVTRLPSLVTSSEGSGEARRARVTIGLWSDPVSGPMPAEGTSLALAIVR